VIELVPDALAQSGRELDDVECDGEELRLRALEPEEDALELLELGRGRAKLVELGLTGAQRVADFAEAVGELRVGGLPRARLQRQPVGLVRALRVVEGRQPRDELADRAAAVGHEAVARQ